MYCKYILTWPLGYSLASHGTTPALLTHIRTLFAELKVHVYFDKEPSGDNKMVSQFNETAAALASQVNVFLEHAEQQSDVNKEMNKNLLEISKISDQRNSENNDVTRRVNQLTGLPQEQQRITGRSY